MWVHTVLRHTMVWDSIDYMLTDLSDIYHSRHLIADTNYLDAENMLPGQLDSGVVCFSLMNPGFQYNRNHTVSLI